MTDWMDNAICVGVDTEVFFPKGHQPDYTQARGICANCPVRDLCASEILRQESGAPASMRFGYQGGLTPGERAELDPRAARVTVTRTLADDAVQLRESLYREGRTDTEIADRIGVPVSRVRAWRIHHQLPPNQGDPNPDTHRQRLYDQGLTDQGIAIETGETRDNVRAWRTRRGLPPNDKRGQKAAHHQPDAERHLHRDPRYPLWKEGLPDKDIAERVGMYVDTIRKWRQRYGLKAAGRWPA